MSRCPLRIFCSCGSPSREGYHKPAMEYSIPPNCLMCAECKAKLLGKMHRYSGDATTCRMAGGMQPRVG